MRSASEKAATVSALRNDGKQMELRAGAKKTLKLTVECLRCSRFAPRSLFNCGIRVESNLVSCNDPFVRRFLMRFRLPAEELAKTSLVTLAHYNAHADSFWEGTRDHDVSQNRDALLQSLQGPGPFRILDFGCGPGRDLKVFRELGHEAIGLEGAERFVELARNYSGCEVWCQDFLKLSLPAEYFDGIFANAALFHAPSQELPRVLKKLCLTLKPDGVLFSSNPRGDNEEGWSGQRYGCYYDWKTWRELVIAAGFAEITHYYRPPGLPRDQQPWLASLWRKV
jgi:SAM-dependent methyltransferase